MIRVVLDTNIIVSALLQSLGPSAQILAMSLAGLVELCVSGNVYAEYEEVISRPRLRRSKEVIAPALQAIREKAVWVCPTEQVQACLDPDDDIFLECAQTAGADYLVTGNFRHFPGAWKSTKVVTPRWFLDMLSAPTSE
jgi:putative PIN family toxin of toxin-antitoxin system